MSSSLKSTIREWSKQGWAAERTSSGHYKLTHPEAGAPVFVSGTPSDQRTFRNVEAQMRRAIRRTDAIRRVSNQPNVVLPDHDAPSWRT